MNAPAQTVRQKKPRGAEYLHEDRTARFLDRNLWMRLAKLIKPHKLLAIGALVFMMVAEALPLLQPRILKAVVDGPIAEQNLNNLWMYALAFLGVVLAGGMLEYLAAVSSQTLGLRVIHDLRVELFERVQAFKMDFFHRTPVGRLMTRLGNDIDSLNSMFTQGLIDLLGAVLLLVYAIIFMFFMNWRMALVTMAVLPLMVLATSIFRVKVRAINTIIRKHVAELNAIMQESLSGISVVQIFGRIPEQFQAFDEVNARTRDAWKRNVTYFSIYFPTILGLTELSVAALYFVGIHLYFGDKVSLGTLIAFSWYAGMFFRPLRELSDRITNLQTALAAGERVFTLYDTQAHLPDGPVRELPATTQLEFRNVRFGYEPGNPVLKGISFTVKEGQSVALVGPTGSGKSTIISLCSRFYLPDAGTIAWNGIDIREVEEAALRRRMSLISQDVYLFAESVAFNIAMGPEYDLDRVRDVCRFVKADLFLEKLPNGYESVLTAKGENLSPGQRQLLAFARALYHNPTLILMDEATASVDTESEVLIQEAMDRVMHSVTTIVVAHRLSTIRSADMILVLHRGEIIEEGKHGDLIEKNGLYRKLYLMQSFE